ncbi:iron-siderophore ABC transporter substrate-binding protein [Pseudomonas chlororaphis]|uniref:ABC transporter substrate-binding protein n=1 Tax=Pseudomonas chlororaphis TaxID=587753 RepID=UPI000E0AAC9F|nr:iron-siderophore ABC transporter substrate-binding protein [Pseudomonas chlororaphis]WDH44712.1 iron-siderophore ABC transporter substrate-binding protein [Pseudomonas chlororaphis]WDH56559.1 iron-siderophore ABC transporter substrate-binding protein [Pseudomonas chlororaphis]WQE15818.1 iron-siderophore ABC transporter substrate-binding protein [Pseudomonas chlororaphis]
MPDPVLHPCRRTLLRLSLGLLALPRIARAEPLRLVTLFQGATDSAVALGVTPCGIVDSWSEKPMYRYLRPAVQGVPHVGLETQPSLEDIALLRPDLIVASRFRHQRIAPLLEQMGRVVMLDEVFEFKRTLALMGAALGRQPQAMELLAQWEQRLGQLHAQLQARFAGRWPLTVAVLDIREDHIRSYLPDSFAGSVLSELGFAWTPAAREARGVSLKLTSKESLPVVNADLFFVFQRTDSPAAQRNYQNLVRHPLWQQLRAPRAGLVWRVDSVAWSLSGGILGANLMLDEIARAAAT